jgi:hypothetical protein
MVRERSGDDYNSPPSDCHAVHFLREIVEFERDHTERESEKLPQLHFLDSRKSDVAPKVTEDAIGGR